MLRFEMIRYKNDRDHIHSYCCIPDHLKTEPVNKNPRFGWIWNGWAVQFWNAIKNQSHSTSEQLSIAQNLNMFGIRAPTVISYMTA